ncbi:MAG: hypothetical protein HY646_16455, partial [Acidobacteria bacterium]|nr:hypothetical protein [Acidobacteriota bacterium]
MTNKVLALALSCLFFAVLFPPEAYPSSRMVLILGSTFAFLIGVLEGRVAASYVLFGFGILALLLAHSLVLSVDVYRSLEFLTIVWAYFCLFGYFVHSGREPSSRYFAATLVLLCMIVSAYGVYQYFWSLDELKAHIASLSLANRLKADMIGRLRSGRVFSTFALPGTLSGFLLMALPMHGLLWNRSRPLNVLLVTSASLLLVTGFLTRSFGFVVGLVVLLALAPVFARAKLSLMKALPVLAFVLVCGILVYFLRQDDLAGANPVFLRWTNWLGAWRIFLANHAGTGLDTYGIVYTQYMTEGANETQYAHNTVLQLMSELGLGVLLLVIGAAIYVYRRKDYIFKAERNEMFFLIASLLLWVIHNLIDINVYFPSIGAVGLALAGILLSPPVSALKPTAPCRYLAMAVGSIALVIFILGSMFLAASELEYESRLRYARGKPSEALEKLLMAQQINPLNSNLFHDAGFIT